MADPSGIQPPYLDPSGYPDYLDVQRKQMLAQMLMQNVQTSGQTPANWDSMRVVPKRGLLQNLAPLANALMARKAMDSSQQAQQKYFQGLYGGGQPQQGPPSGPGAGIISPDAPQDQQGAAQQVTDQPAHSGLLPQQPNPMLPPGASRGAAQMALGMMGPEEYAKGVMLPNLMGSPKWQDTLRAYGGNVAAAQAAMQAEAVKSGAIANRSGEENLIPQGFNPDGTLKYQSIRTPNLSPDMDYTRNPDMSVAEAHNIPGAVPALAGQKAAVTAAEEQNKPRMIPMGAGVERFGYPQDIGAGLPPALRGMQSQQAGAAPVAAPQSQRSYFPKPEGQQQAPQANPIPVKGQGGTFDNNLWPGIPKMQIPVSPGQTTNDYQKKIIDSAAAKHQELVNKFGEGSAQAVLSNNYLDQALRHLPAAETGPMSEWLTENRGKLLEVAPGIGKLLPSTGTVTPTLELNKALVNSGLQGAKANFGRLTQAEVMLQKDEMSPSAKMTHDAIAALIHQQQIKNDYAIQQDKDYGEYHAQNGDPNRFEAQYNVRRPLTRFSAQFDTHPQALERLRQHPELLNDFKTRYGWDPTQ